MVSSAASNPAFGRRLKGHALAMHNANNGSGGREQTVRPPIVAG
jgi:hypothetical protein